MQFVQLTLKNKNEVVGYITNTYGSQIQLLQLKDKTLTFTALSKSSLDNVRELRPLTKKERELLENYIAYSKELGSIEYRIRKFQQHQDLLNVKRNKSLEALLIEAVRVEEKEMEILTVSDMEGLLIESGFKNLFLLQRYGLLALGEREEVFYVNEDNQFVPLLVKQSERVATLLNQNGLSKEVAFAFLSQMAIDATNDKRTEDVKKENQGNEEEVPPKEKRLNFTDIKGSLNEQGFQTLRKLQENHLLTIHEDGTIDFGEIGTIPFLKDILHNPKLVVNILNQPLPTFPGATVIPFPIGNLGGLLKEIERQFYTEK